MNSSQTQKNQKTKASKFTAEDIWQMQEDFIQSKLEVNEYAQIMYLRHGVHTTTVKKMLKGKYKQEA